MGWQVLGELRSWNTTEDATPALGESAQPLLTSQQLVWVGGARVVKTFPCLWRQTLHFSGKSLPSLLREQRPLFCYLARFQHFETSQLTLLAEACFSPMWFIWNDGPVKISVRMANFCLQEFLSLWFYAFSAESTRRIKFFFCLTVRRMLALTVTNHIFSSTSFRTISLTNLRSTITDASETLSSQWRSLRD